MIHKIDYAIIGKKLTYSSTFKNFFITVLATLIGVFCATWLNDYQQSVKEKQDTKKLLNTSITIINNAAEYSNRLLDHYEKLLQDTIKFDLAKQSDFKQKNPLPYPEHIATIFTNELIFKNVSQFTHSTFFSGLVNLKKIKSYDSAKLYISYLEDIKVLLSMEIDLQYGKINQHEFKTAYLDKIQMKGTKQISQKSSNG